MWRLEVIKQTFVDIYYWLVTLAVINMIWLACSLTVILFPPATAALYAVAADATRGEAPEVSAYLRAIRAWFWRSWLWGLVTGGMAVLIGVAIDFYTTQSGGLNAFLSGVMIVLGFFFIGMQLYVWPYMMFLEEPLLLRALRNALLTILADPPFTFIHVGLALLLLAVSLVLVAPLGLITASLLAFLGTYGLRAWLVHYGFLDAETGRVTDAGEGEAETETEAENESEEAGEDDAGSP